ncbi:MAG: ATP synthase F0 subunit B [Candidatus Taylorbacteria bacterium RIFCSPHIGHO2_01_FULL_51_15]|uniref:ATP synthase subunit b n=1 Tax=Candidatus Taylorbacteria bacterium RIFCSPHIGHO2_01_FULL_51_15 TaxID=1802304 RepID=A0A1G2M9Q4_9BACT|nr:MAG: ATP synthase F0 subunit B [Candidatus Taylorbacteria bacterium RIFCSPHIGHO2_01_FULL_51_15]
MSELLHSLGIEWPILIAQLVNFAILLFILERFVYRPIIKLLDKRREDIATSAKRDEEIRAKLGEMDIARERVLTEARAQSQKILDEAKEDAERLRGKMILAAQEEIARNKADAERRLEASRVRLLAEVKGEIGTLIVDTIEKTLGDVLDERTQGKMVEQALAAIREGQKK